MIKKIRFKARVVTLPKVCQNCGNIFIAECRTGSVDDFGNKYFTRYKFCDVCGWKSKVHKTGSKPATTIIKIKGKIPDEVIAINTATDPNGVYG